MQISARQEAQAGGTGPPAWKSVEAVTAAPPAS
jgi:hypothetical protein